MQIIVRGDAQAIADWQAQIQPRLWPFQSAHFIDRTIQELPEELAAKTSSAAACAWVCEGFNCREPIKELDLLLELIDE